MQEYGIGNTSLKELEAINGNRIFVKLEKENALGSIKARTAYGIMKELPREAQNKIIVESTSGNLGLALGFFLQGGRISISLPDRFFHCLGEA